MAKRLLDLCAAFFGLVLTSPVLAIVLFLVWRQDRHSPLYVAPRVGRGGRPFRMVKVRSMIVGGDRTGVSSTSADDFRITPLGHFIRRWKIDEVPQLWNVLRGDMSLVGPRPNTPGEVARYTGAERRLLDVRPGITDLSSIVFSDEGEIIQSAADPDVAYRTLIWPWKSRLALIYVQNSGLGLDLQLIYLTIVAIFDKQRALRGLHRILRRHGAHPALIEAASRKVPMDQLTNAAEAAGPTAPAEIRVLFLHNFYSRRIGMFMWDILEELKKTSWLNLEDYPLPLVKRLGDAWTVWRQMRTLPREYDLVHAQYGSMVALAARWSHQPYLVSFRGSDVYPHPGTWRQRLGGRVRLIMSYLAARRACACVVMSHAMEHRMRNWPGLRHCRFHVLVDPCNVAFWPDADHNLAPAIAEASLEVVTASLQADNPVKRLEIVRQAQKLCAMVGLSVTIRQMVGLEQDEVRAALRKADFLAISSTHEGWPNIVKEALLTGTPFISTDVSDLKDYSLRFPRSRIVADNPVDFAFAFVDALAQKALSLGVRGDGLAPFHPQVCALKHQILYRTYGNAE